jgi:hypothetical protein
VHSRTIQVIEFHVVNDRNHANLEAFAFISTGTTNRRSRLTYQAHQPAQTTAVRTTEHATATALALNKKFHDGHGRAVDGILLSTTARTAMLIKELRSLRHSHADQLRLRLAAATAATGRKLLKYLHEQMMDVSHGTLNSDKPDLGWNMAYLRRRGATQRRRGQAPASTPLIYLAVRILNMVLIYGMIVLAL